METRRKRFQGVLNILHFNWPFFATALASWVALGIAAAEVDAPLDTLFAALLLFSAGLTLLSLAVSLYIYDLSGLYRLSWLDGLAINERTQVLNINAGFDETSALLQQRFRPALSVWDFYDPARHTEPSIARARAAWPPWPGTLPVHTASLPASGPFDRILLTFAAHEIRDDAERTAFFRGLRERLSEGGRIVLTEHLRDGANTLAYHFGVRHFLPRASWLRTFRDSGLAIETESKFTPFVTTFVLHAAAAS